MKIIKEFFLNQKLKQKVVPGSPVVPELLQIRYIGLLAASEEEFLLGKEILRDLWGYQIRIVGMYYTEVKPRPIDGISYRDFNLIGRPNAYFNEFLEEKQDFILVASKNLNSYLRYLLHLKKDVFKLGFFNTENRPFLDLMLETENPIEKEDIQSLIDYLKRIYTTC
jgi:hypothetical protein